MNKITRDLLIAARFSNYRVYSKLRDRIEDIHHADTPELHVDIESVWEEAKTANFYESVRRVVHFTLFLLLIINYETFKFSVSEYEYIKELNYKYISITVLLCFLLELVFYFWKRNLCKKHLKNEITEYNNDTSNVNILDDQGTVRNDGIKGGDSSDLRQNIVISSSFNPFIGFGMRLGDVSFIIDLKKPLDKDIQPNVVNVKQFYDSIEREIVESGISEYCTSEDVLFVFGKDASKHGNIIKSINEKPNCIIDTVFINNHIEASGDLRYYKFFIVDQWDGDIIVSAGVRIIKTGTDMYIEYKIFLLTPVSSLYNYTEEVGKKLNFTSTLKIILKTVYITPISVILAVLWFYERIFFYINLIIAQIFGDPILKEKKSNREFNYGRDSSFREAVSSGLYYRYFQLADKEFAYKILQQKIIDGIIKTLEDNGISTESIVGQRDTLINNGLLIAGGQVNIEALAAGKGSKAVMKNVNQFLNIGGKS